MNLQADQIFNSQDDDISLSEIWQAVADRWLVVASSVALWAGVAAAVAFSMTPIYRAEVVVTAVEDSKSSGIAGQFGGLASLAGVSLGSSSTRNESVGTLGSKQLIERYITGQNLLPLLYEKRWDGTKGDWNVPPEMRPTTWKATQMFTKKVRSVTEDKKTGLITLAIEWADPKLAAQWANGVVALANETLRQRAIDTSTQNIDYLNGQLAQTNIVELKQSIYRLIETEIKTVMVARGNNQYAFKIIDPATVPEKKTKPKRAIIVAIGALLGFGIASLWAIARRPRVVRTAVV